MYFFYLINRFNVCPYIVGNQNRNCGNENSAKLFRNQFTKLEMQKINLFLEGMEMVLSVD
jgi:hypothetical protein